MYKLTCREIGLDCSFVVKNSERKVICDNFSQHLFVKHNRMISAKKILALLENKNKDQHEERKTNYTDEHELLKLEKWSFGKRNFP